MLRSNNTIETISFVTNSVTRNVTNSGTGSLVGAFIGFCVYAITLASAGNVVFRKDSKGVYRFRFIGSLVEGIVNPFFRYAPSFSYGVQFFFRLDNPWFTVPTGALIGYFIF